MTSYSHKASYNQIATTTTGEVRLGFARMSSEASRTADDQNMSSFSFDALQDAALDALIRSPETDTSYHGETTYEDRLEEAAKNLTKAKLQEDAKKRKKSVRGSSFT